MASTPLFDLKSIDLTKVVVDREKIYQRLPHRFEFCQLDAIVHFDLAANVAVARREVRTDEFWVRGHIPGRPLLPGVLMIETAAQLASYLSSELLKTDKFIGFARADKIVFRAAVSPPATMYFVMKMVDLRSRRITGEAQAFVDDQLVFEGTITGMPI
jgi:3-hydroxyacyl-[acyl-carrier-protein] dehydratase